jgi:hypothetical protein
MQGLEHSASIQPLISEMFSSVAPQLWSYPHGLSHDKWVKLGSE